VLLTVTYYDDFADAIRSGTVTTRDGVLRLKAQLCKKHGLSKVPTNYEILERVPEDLRPIAEPLLRNKPVRTLSGVAPIAVMTSPHDCPHGRCAYCPGGVTNNSPQSYTGREPAALRAAMYEFDPYRQTKARLEQLRAIGHRTDKVELIVMGGTFTAREPEYQEWFTKRCFDAMNGFDSRNLDAAQAANEHAGARCVGLTVETRPDNFTEAHVEMSMKLGATKVELGVQILDDDILHLVDRGHGINDVVDATKRAKDAGLKVCYHMMPGLPGANQERDLESFRKLFEDQRFMPDMLKIYPTLVVKGTRLYDAWAEGRYSPLTLEDGVRLLKEMKLTVPPWVRILRIQRDIPVQLIEAGIRKSHLRELVREALASDNARCRCIRCREVGHSDGDAADIEGAPELRRTEFAASDGEEVFLSYEYPERDILVGYARLRFPGDGTNRSIVRELHVYGRMVPIHQHSDDDWQHRGFGESLLSECEEIAASHGSSRLIVTSGVGAREYYASLGYSRSGFYMAKELSRA